VVTAGAEVAVTTAVTTAAATAVATADSDPERMRVSPSSVRDLL
jgi:hypothetical protein